MLDEDVYEQNEEYLFQDNSDSEPVSEPNSEDEAIEKETITETLSESVVQEKTEGEEVVEVVGENKSESTETLKNQKIDENDKLDGKKSFIIRLIIASILGIAACILIRPRTSDLFYIAYFIIFIAFSLGVLFCCCMAQKDISSLWKFYKKFKNSYGRKEDLISEEKPINDICDAYKESFLQNETYTKTRANADLYFGGETYFNDMHHIPFQSFLKIIPGTFIGFGILGTFIGFAGGLGALDLSDSQTLLSGVQNLLFGLKSAFNTSIVGVFASIFLNFVMIHPLFNRLDRCSKELCDYLDEKFFVSEVEAMSVTDENGMQIPFPQTMELVLDRLKDVDSNINLMGSVVGDRVADVVKENLDKKIEQIIHSEITKMKEEMNSSIKLLQECQKHLQNAPVHIKEAGEKMQAVTLKNRQILEQSFTEYSRQIDEVSEELLNIKNTLALLPEDFRNIDKSIQSTTTKLSDNQQSLETSLEEASSAFEKTTEISQSLVESYDTQSQKIDDMISKFQSILNEYKEISNQSKELLSGFNGMDEQISTIFNHINENTKNYSDVIGKSLTGYLQGFSDATKDVSVKFADATNALREEVEKLNKISKEKN